MSLFWLHIKNGEKNVLSIFWEIFLLLSWDEKKQQIFCARDHVGVKQFYYYLMMIYLFLEMIYVAL